MGCRVTHWLPQETGAGWWFDPQRLEALLTPQTRLLVTNFPHNPTGALPNADEFGAVVNAAARHGMTHFSDEMYRLLEHDPADRLPAAVDLYEGAVSLGGTSKSLAVAGLRIGWLATRNAAWMASFAAYKDYTTICAAAPSEILALAALRARDRIVRRNLDIVAGNLALLDAFFRRHAGQFDWARPRAGTVTFPRLRESGPAEAFCADLLARKGVLLLPGEVYEYTGDGDGGHFRVGYGRVNLPEALAHLDEYLIESHRGV
jgi:aspartate/methionine/tyrosine aminotransferase